MEFFKNYNQSNIYQGPSGLKNANVFQTMFMKENFSQLLKKRYGKP